MKPAYRSVFRELLRRELGERYRGSLLGVLWHLLLPLSQLLVLSWVFSHLLQARTQYENLSYAAFLALGLWPWNLFANAVSNSVAALTGNAALIGKIALPHHLLVDAKVSASVLLDLAGFAVVLLALMLIGTSLKLTGVPVVLLSLAVLYVFAVGFANIVAVLNVFLRDVGAAISQILSLLFFLTPVIYDLAQLPKPLQQWLILNPFAAPIMAIRQALLGLPVDWPHLGISALFAIFIAYVGYALLRRARPHLEDYFMTGPALPLVEVNHISKRYPVLANSTDRLSALWDMLRGRAPTRHTTVLSDINFNVMPGCSIGIIGENGAGKSTLLKLITKVLTPSDGEVVTRGAIGALLELGAGFHPEYSGRENVRLSAALYGISDVELKQKMQEIEEFADIGHYMDEPTKHYSSGMIVRLGFAIIAAVRPPLLITDEVLGVGDESFQKKCSRWIDEYVNSGGTLLLVSHSMYHVQKLCREAIWLHHGRIEMQGDVFSVTQHYLAWHESKRTGDDIVPEQTNAIYEYGIEKIIYNDSSDDAALQCQSGADYFIDAVLTSQDDTPPVMLVGWVREDGTPVYGISSEMDGVKPIKTAAGKYRFRICFTKIAMLPGRYKLRIHSLDSQGLRLFQTIDRHVTVTGESRAYGLVFMPHRWE